MLFEYHKLDKENNLSSLCDIETQEIVEIIQFISARPIASFFVYQIENFGDDLHVWAEPYKGFLDSFDHCIGYVNSNLIQNMLIWSIIVPLLLYFGITRFFRCLFRWRKYYRDASLILLKIS